MRSILRLARLALAGLAIWAAVASPASAALHTGSATGPVVAAGTNIAWNSTNVVFTGSFNSQVKCANASLTSTSSNYGTNPISGNATALSFSTCTLASDGSTCTITVTNVNTLTPIQNSTNATGVNAGNNTFSMTTTQYITITCTVPLIGTQTCHYTTPSGGITGAWTADAASDTTTFNGVTLSLTTNGGPNSATCSSSTTLTGSFRTTVEYILSTM